MRDRVAHAYRQARERYAELGIDSEAVLSQAATIPLAVNCWQADDVAGFDGDGAITGGGILATGAFPGRARTVDELRADFDFARALMPGTKRFNLHASYLDAPGRTVDRDAIEPRHFRSWIEWAAHGGFALDFNPTYFSHPNAADGFTLAHPDRAVRDFWIEHGVRARDIAAAMGAAQHAPCINNLWIPDGFKDLPADRLGYRERLIESLDRVYARPLDPAHVLDAVESKLFGIGSESFVVGSHEFYLGYALTRNVGLTLDAGHYHPTEQLADKISALLPFCRFLLLHVSRPVRWDSDHVVLFDDATRAIMGEVCRARAWDRAHLAVDFFDASINRIAAWVIGVRSTYKAILYALLEPTRQIVAAERDGRLADRLAWHEEAKTLPFGAIWDMFCERAGVPTGPAWIEAVATYGRDVLAQRA